jgi:hypothetical protein
LLLRKRNEKNQKRNETKRNGLRNETKRNEKNIEYQEKERNETITFRKRNETMKKKSAFQPLVYLKFFFQFSKLRNSTFRLKFWKKKSENPLSFWRFVFFQPLSRAKQSTALRILKNLCYFKQVSASFLLKSIFVLEILHCKTTSA